MSGPLAGRSAIVTGGGRGIGAAVAAELTRRGARVTVFARTREELSAVVAAGDAERAEAGDVAREADVARLVEAHEAALGPCAVLVNGAGILERGRVDEMEPSAWRRVLEVNLTGAFLASRAVLPGMRRRRSGRIVNVASISGTLGTPMASAYNASKWGLLGFTRSLAEEVREDGVQVLSVSPSGVDTRLLAQTPFPAVVRVEEVARVVAWAAGEAPDAMTGANLEVYG